MNKKLPALSVLKLQAAELTRSRTLVLDDNVFADEQAHFVDLLSNDLDIVYVRMNERFLPTCLVKQNETAWVLEKWNEIPSNQNIV